MKCFQSDWLCWGLFCPDLTKPNAILVQHFTVCWVTWITLQYNATLEWMRGWQSRGSKWKDGETTDHVLQAPGCPEGSLQIASETVLSFLCFFGQGLSFLSFFQCNVLYAGCFRWVGHRVCWSTAIPPSSCDGHHHCYWGIFLCLLNTMSLWYLGGDTTIPHSPCNGHQNCHWGIIACCPRES